MNETLQVTESEFVPDNVLPLTRSERKQALRPERLLVQGRRVVKFKISVPVEQYEGLQRFEGRTDAEKVLAILRMANRRVDEVSRMAQEERMKLQTVATEPAPE